MMRAKLNTFQRTVLMWNDMHPYNAVHVVKISCRLDPARLKNVIDSCLEACGLTNLMIDRNRKEYQYNGGKSDVTIEIIRGEEGGDTLVSEIRRQLDVPFDLNGEIKPFRFFAMEEGGAFHLGLIYFHLIAGADSIIVLIKSLIEKYMEGERSGPYPVFDLYPNNRCRVQGWSRYLVKWLVSLPRHVALLRRSCRPDFDDLVCYDTGFELHSFGPDDYAVLVSAARKWGVTLNDLFLAMLLKALSPLAFRRLEATRRKDISVASIVNIRKDLAFDNPRIFGLFLGYFNVSHMVPGGVDLKTVSEAVHAETEKIKKNRLYLWALAEMRVALLLFPYFFSKRKNKFYSKYHPVWGGITNINLNTFWQQADEKPPEVYLRAVSTGSATPLVLSFTTVHDKISVGISYKETVFSKEDIRTILSGFSMDILQLKGDRQ